MLARLALRDQPVALVAADQRMPGMTGIQLLEPSRTHAPGAKLLIDNAVDAMDGHGVLRLSTGVDGDHVVVRIADSGSGMTPAVVARAFDAFFTTKEVGHGTGLGLDIAQRIVVDRHRGDITTDSAPRRYRDHGAAAAGLTCGGPALVSITP